MANKTAAHEVHIPALDVYFGTPWHHKSDSDIESITRILELNGLHSWSASPRLYCVLRMIDRVDLMDELLGQGMTDFWLPVSPRGTKIPLPPQLYEAQQYILTRKFTATTTWLDRRHLHCLQEDVLPFQDMQQVLGQGSYGAVDKIYDFSAQRFLARKRFDRYGDSHFVMQAVESTIRTNKRLSHRHCVEFVGSYTTPRFVGVILTPAADCNLLEFLSHNGPPFDSTHVNLLQSWVGCLASALLYSHNSNIAHYDIKPSNILVTGKTILLTDFSLSSNWSENLPETLEDGDRRLLTPLEPLKRAVRIDWDGPSDIWSLGCIFLEILISLAGYTLDFLPNSSKAKWLSEQYLLDKNPGFLEREVGELVQKMMAYNPIHRPTANQVASKIREITDYAPQWCGSCCIRTLSDDQRARAGLHQLVESQESYSEADIQYIGRKLAFEQMVEWSSIPRTYIILALMNRLDLMSMFLQVGVSDLWFPYDRQLLRQFLKDPKAIQGFLDNQNAVLSSKLLQYEHQHFMDGSDYLQDIKELGSGGFGSVWHSFDPQSHRHVAKKLIPRVKIVAQSRAKDATDMYERELAMLRRVSAEKHRHLVQMVGSYTDLSDFVILFSPVADMNLATYMDDPLSEENLRRWFGCLATALQYLHRMKIRYFPTDYMSNHMIELNFRRHKDIKPQNVLVVGENIMLTDFGISYDWSDNSRPTTSGPGARDPRYCAPEVAEWEARNESADVWSLGCVFLEMQSVLLGHGIADIRSHFGSQGTRASWYHKNEAALESWFQILSRSASARPFDGVPMDWVQKMVVFDKDSRLCCDDVVDLIVDPSSGDMERIERYCGRCCIDAYNKSSIVFRSNEAEPFVGLYPFD